MGMIGGGANRNTIKNSTGSASGASPITVTMNDWSFFASLANASGNSPIQASTSDIGNTTGVFVMALGAGTEIARWRYITSSDNPFIQVLKDISGKIIGVWESEDPIEILKGKSESEILLVNEKLLPIYHKDQKLIEVFYPLDVIKFKNFRKIVSDSTEKNFFDYLKNNAGINIRDLS